MTTPKTFLQWLANYREWYKKNVPDKSFYLDHTPQMIDFAEEAWDARQAEIDKLIAKLHQKEEERREEQSMLMRKNAEQLAIMEEMAKYCEMAGYLQDWSDSDKGIKAFEKYTEYLKRKDL